MRIPRRAASGLAASFLVLSVGACSSAGSSSGDASSSSTGSAGVAASSSSPINILVMADTTGPTKAYGSQELAGLMAAVNYYNGKGGIDGHKVVVTHVSDNGDPATSASLLTNELSSNPGKFTMVYGGAEGTVIQALIPIIARYPVIAAAAGDDSLCSSVKTCPHQFSQVGPNSLPQATDADWMQTKGYKKVGILEEQIAFTESETPAFKADLTTAGISNSEATFTDSAVDLTAQMSQLKAAGAQAVFVLAVGPAAGYALKARAALNWNVPILFDDAASSFDITTLVSKSLYANSFQTLRPVCVATLASPAYKDLVANLPAGTKITLPANLVADGWDPIVMLDSAVTQAHSLDVQALTSALDNLDTAGQNNPEYLLTPKLRFTAANHENVDDVPGNFAVVPVQPIVNGQVATGSKS